MKELLEYLISGKSYCTDYYEIFYVEDQDEIYFGSKSCGYMLTKEQFLEIEDIEKFEISL